MGIKSYQEGAKIIHTLELDNEFSAIMDPQIMQKKHRELALKYHPDKHPNAQDEMNEIMSLINSAYETYTSNITEFQAIMKGHNEPNMSALLDNHPQDFSSADQANMRNVAFAAEEAGFEF